MGFISFIHVYQPCWNSIIQFVFYDVLDFDIMGMWFKFFFTYLFVQVGLNNTYWNSIQNLPILSSQWQNNNVFWLFVGKASSYSKVFKLNKLHFALLKEYISKKKPFFSNQQLENLLYHYHLYFMLSFDLHFYKIKIQHRKLNSTCHLYKPKMG